MTVDSRAFFQWRREAEVTQYNIVCLDNFHQELTEFMTNEQNGDDDDNQNMLI